MLYEAWQALKMVGNQSQAVRQVEEFTRLEEKHRIINDFYIKHGVYL